MAAGRTALNLDLDSLLQLQSSDEEDDRGGIAHRTVEDILNDSDASSSDSDASSPSSLRSDVPFRPLFPPKPDSKSLGISTPTVGSMADPESPKSEKSEDKVSLISVPRSVFSESRIGFLRRKHTDGEWTGTISSGRGNSLLPSLFGAIKPNPRPGAALAAAAAASRSVPTPHAAAIKFKRTELQKTIRTDGNGSSTVIGEEIDEKPDEVKKHEEEAEPAENARTTGSDEEPSLEEDNVGHQGSDFTLFDSQTGSDAGWHNNEEVLDRVVQGDVLDASVKEPVGNSDQTVETSITTDVQPLMDTIVEGIVETTHIERLESVEGDNISVLLEGEPRLETTITKFSLEWEEFDPIEGNPRAEAGEFADDISILSGSKKSSKRQSKKSKTSLKPLELAEELEKKNAFSGLHLEEGAAAQPMRLEGIRRGPPAVGYLQLDTDNGITHAISSQPFRREHGLPQSLTVHLNFIAVGMTKGTVIVMPSKYSPHSADNLDSKVIILGPQGEKSRSPVTSMCFSQQGDLLLVGYASGGVIVWDVQRASVAKTIGEHTAPIVHTLFLGQDPQVARQFKAVTGDCKGLVLLHTISVFPILNHYNITTQCLLDGQRTGVVLCASPLLLSEIHFGSLAPGPGSSTVAPGGIGSMMGGVVGGVVGGEAGWKLFADGSSPEEEGVVIFVTHQNALVVRLSPSLQVYAQLPKPDGVREGSMPYTAWKCVISPQTSPEEFEKAALLAVAWDRKILVTKLVKSELQKMHEWSIDSAAVGVAWLDDRMLVLLTLRGQICLFTKDGNELHRSSYLVDGCAGDDMIAYHTYFTNSFGNPERACHNSVAVRGATIYVLGQVHLVASRLLPWKERVKVLQKAGDWMGALDMAMKVYDGNTHGVIDLPRSTDAIREAVMPFLVELLTSYVDEVFSYISVAFCSQIEKLEASNGLQDSPIYTEIKEQYARVGGVAVEFCVHIKKIDILFEDIFSKFSAVQHGGTFLEILEPYILKDMLGSLPPEIMQALVEHYSSKGWLRRVEQCVLHMDISSLDFNQVVKLCREHGLYSALIYLFNKGLDDFKAPLEELLLVSQDCQQGDAVGIGYRMLVYLKYCFLGLAFPPGQGELPPSRLSSLRKELIEYLLENSSSQNSQFVTSFKSSLGSCLNLFYLLWLDTAATLEVLQCAFFKDQYNKVDTPLSHSIDLIVEENMDTRDANKSEDITLSQNITNALVSVLDIEVPGVDTSSSDSYDSLSLWPSKKERGYLLEFIACFVACQQATISQNLFNHILEYLASDTDTFSSFPEQGHIPPTRKQKQVLALLKAVPETQWDSSYVLQVCEQAKYYEVCSLIHIKRGQHIEALDSYIKDINEPIHAFAFISDMMSKMNDAKFLSFRMAVASRIPDLVRLNRQGAFLLVVEHFGKEHQHILSILRSQERCLFQYLKTAVDVQLTGSLDFSSLTKEDISVHPFYGVDHMGKSDEILAYLDKLSNFSKIARSNPINIVDDLAELYLELMCQFEPCSVLRFLETFENYRVEHCLRICQKYGVIDAAAYLLERAGDVGSSLSLVLSGINSQLDNIYSAVRRKVEETSIAAEFDQLNAILSMQEVISVHSVLLTSTGLCQRNTPRLDHQESQSLWFHLLDSFCKPLRHLSGLVIEDINALGDDHAASKSKRISDLEKTVRLSRRVISQFVGEIVQGMVGYVPLPNIMTKLLSDSQGQQFGDFKGAILGMLGKYGYERRILDTAKILIEDDTYYIMSLLQKGASHAYAPQSHICCICSNSLTKERPPSSVHVFHCGHAVHVQCEVGGNELNVSSVACPICMPKKNHARVRSKSILVENGLVKRSPPRTDQRKGNLLSQPLRESELVERPYGLQQISRFDMLNNLQKVQRTLQVDSLPRLRLAPPAIYHEKVKMTTDISVGEASISAVRNDKPSKIHQLKNLKAKGSSFQFPLTPSIFLTEKNRKR